MIKFNDITALLRDHSAGNDAHHERLLTLLSTASPEELAEIGNLEIFESLRSHITDESEEMNSTREVIPQTAIEDSEMSFGTLTPHIDGDLTLAGLDVNLARSDLQEVMMEYHSLISTPL